MKQSWRKFTSKFKVMVAVDALKERKSLIELDQIRNSSDAGIGLETGISGPRRKAFGDEPTKEEDLSMLTTSWTDWPVPRIERLSKKT